MASIIPIGDKWRATVRAKDGGKLTFNRSRTFPTKKQAEAWATMLEAEILTKGTDAISASIRSNGVTVRDLIERYSKEFDRSPKLFGDTKRNVLKTLAESSLGELSVTRLTSQEIITWCRERHDATNVGASTLYQYLTYLRLPLRMARPAWNMPNVTTAPVDDALPVLTQQGLVGQGKERDRRLHGDEFARLLAKLIEYQNRPRATTRHADVFEFAVASAFRLGEILRIRWDDIDPVGRTVVIRDRKDPRNKIGNHQRVPLLGRAWDIVQAQPRADNEQIFPFSETTVSMTFGKAVDALGLLDLRFHDLRHEGTSRLFEAGYQIQEVALITGHKNWNMLRRYTQIRPESLHRKHIS